MDTLWNKSLLELSQALSGQMRLVGGCVRDFLLGISPSDIDISTPLLPRQVMTLLSEKHIKTYPIALGHGVVGATLHHQSFEITTLRQDLYSQTFQEKTHFITDYTQDSNRRDFTINALYLDTKNTLYDYHHGREDLMNHRVRFIGNPEQRLLEDPLRLMRYLRFWAVYGDETPDSTILSFFESVGPLLSTVSPFRRHKELVKIISSPRSDIILNILDSFHLFPFICQGFDEKKLDLPPTFMAYFKKRKDVL